MAWYEKQRASPLSSKKFPDFSSALALDLRRSIFRWIEESVWKENISWQAFLKMDKIHVNEQISAITI